MSNSSLNYRAAETSSNIGNDQSRSDFPRSSVQNVKEYTHLFTCVCFLSKPCSCWVSLEDGTEKKSVFPSRFKGSSPRLIILFSFGAAVYTGPGPVKDVFSTSNRMTVLFITDDVFTKGGFKANFTTGYHLGFPGKGIWD